MYTSTGKDSSGTTLSQPVGGNMAVYKELFIVSVTINILLILIHGAKVAVRLLWRHYKSKPGFVPDKDCETFIHKHAGQIGGIIADALLTLALLAGAFYLIIGGQILQYSAPDLSPSTISIATAMFSMTTGRVVVAMVMTFQRVDLIPTPVSSSGMVMMLVEQVLMVAAMSVILHFNEDFLTGAYLIIMCTDHPLYSVNALLDKLHPCTLTTVRAALKVTQCFLSLSFRMMVPIVCLFLHYLLYEQSIFALSTPSVILYVSLTLFYVCFNMHRIVTGATALIAACRQDKVKEAGKMAAKQSYFINNKPDLVKKKIPLEFHFNKNDIRSGNLPSVSYLRTDFESYLDQNLPPPYSNIQGSSTHTFSSAELCAARSPSSGSQLCDVDLFKPCSNVNLFSSVSSSSSSAEPVRQNSMRKMYGKQPMQVETPLPTIQEETDSFTDIQL